MSTFLNDQDIGPRIFDVLTGHKLKCAVAFWGSGASAALFSGKLPSDAKIVCDISMGGTNPDALIALGAPKNLRIRHVPGLHAKVYISNKGVVTGSANASSRGIGFTGNAALTEAGTFHEPGSGIHEDASRWFDELWARAFSVDQEALNQAKAAWDRRPPETRTASMNSKSLLEAAAADPDRFRGVGFVFTSSGATEEERDEIAENLKIEDPAVARALPSWPVEDVFNEWEQSDIDAWPRLFVCAHRPKSKLTYWFCERVYAGMLGDENGVVLSRFSEELETRICKDGTAELMAKADTKMVAQLFERVIGKNGNVLYENSEKLLKHLRRLDTKA